MKLKICESLWPSYTLWSSYETFKIKYADIYKYEGTDNIYICTLMFIYD